MNVISLLDVQRPAVHSLFGSLYFINMLEYAVHQIMHRKLFFLLGQAVCRTEHGNMENRRAAGLFRHRKGILAGMPQHRCLRPDITDHCRLVFTAHPVQYVEDGIHNHTAGTVDISFQARHIFSFLTKKHVSSIALGESDRSHPAAVRSKGCFLLPQHLKSEIQLTQPRRGATRLPDYTGSASCPDWSRRIRSPQDNTRRQSQPMHS